MHGWTPPQQQILSGPDIEATMYGDPHKQKQDRGIREIKDELIMMKDYQYSSIVHLDFFSLTCDERVGLYIGQSYSK